MTTFSDGERAAIVKSLGGAEREKDPSVDFVLENGDLIELINALVGDGADHVDRHASLQGNIGQFRIFLELARENGLSVSLLLEHPEKDRVGRVSLSKFARRIK